MEIIFINFIISFAHFLLFSLNVTKVEAAGNSQQIKAFSDQSGPSSSNSPLFSSFRTTPSAVMCGKHKVSVPLLYKSDQNRETINLLVTDDKIEVGGNGQFFVGFTSANHRLDSLPINKCVAIKKMICTEEDKYCNAIRVLKWIQQHIDSAKRGHITKLFDAGYEHATDSFVIVSELGDETLKERLYDKERNFLIEEMVSKTTMPLLELHRVAMHLDIKPSNYVFVKSEEEEEDALKLIDFDGAELLVERAGQSQCKIPQVNAHTIQYMSPEQDEHIFKQRTELSVKADIWAIGIITCEIILKNRFYYYLFSEENDFGVDLVLHYIGKFYRGYRIVHDEKSQEAEFHKLNLDGEEWLGKSNYYDTLAHIMRIAADFPLFFHLIMNTLNFDPEKRMTARGIVDYLDRKCIPETSEQIVNVSSLPFFHNVTVGRLRRIFEIRKDKKMLDLLEIVEKQQRKALDQLQKREKTCETKNVLIDEEKEENENLNENLNLKQTNELAMGQLQMIDQREEKKLKDKIKQLFSPKSKKKDLRANAKTKFGLLKKSREESDKPFMAK